MINTLYGLDALGTSKALFLALAIGFGFGFALERAGFSSSRRLAGVFYFRDMAVVKVMFSAMVTAMLGLSALVALGWLSLDQVFLMPTVYGAQIAGGLIFGIGFAMGAWCPGTAAAGLAAGRIDALVFLIGTVGGSVAFNETFAWMAPLYRAGDAGTLMVYDSLGVSRTHFVLSLTVVAVIAFWLSEWAEKVRTGKSAYLGSPFLKAFSLLLVALAAGLSLLGPVPGQAAGGPPPAATAEGALLAKVDAAGDHIEPEELADRLMAGEADLTVVDVRPAAEFRAFHIRGARNIPLPELAAALSSLKGRGTIVLYSNGMTHPAQARDSLQRLGFENVYLLTDGLQGFRDRCLKPVSLRPEPLAPSEAARVNAWRSFFAVPPPLPAKAPAGAPTAPATAGPAPMPRLVTPAWLLARLGGPGLKVIDLRPQPEYNTAHIPGALSLNVESLRGNAGGLPSMLLPAPMLAAQFSLLGLEPSDSVVLVAGDKPHDATLAAMAFERLGHRDYAVLDGGHAAWTQTRGPTDAALPRFPASAYPVRADADRFTVDAAGVSAAMGRPGTVILDVRPADFYAGRKSEEARPGHIPGALNRPYTEDIVTASNKVATLKPVETLAAAYAQLIPSRDTPVVVHCRTGHQASQTFFVLRHLLGYTDVRWYDAGWTEWAARPDLPAVVEKAPAAAK